MFKALKRRGKHPLKFQVDIIVHSLNCEGSGPTGLDAFGSYSVQWSRGSKISKTAPLPPEDGPGGAQSLVTWEQPLTLIVTLYRDSTTHKFESKPASLEIHQSTAGVSLVQFLVSSLCHLSG